MTGRFARYISKADKLDKGLPLAHTTDGFDLRKVMDSRKLRPTQCDVFNEPLLYMFYGRPAFRPTTVKKATSLGAASLVSFLVDPNSLPAAKRIFPFDSGAMHLGLYAAHMHPGMALDDFKLSANLAQPKKAIKIFFGTNARYYRGLCLKNKIPQPMEFEAQSFHSLIQTIAQSDPDDRRGTIELQYASAIELTPKNLLAVILPEDFYDDADVSKFVKRYPKVARLKYVCYHAQPSADAVAILEIARKFLESKKLL